MRADQLKKELDAWERGLLAHRQSWIESLGGQSRPAQDFAKLEKESRELRRTLGKLRPYLTRFRRSWILQGPDNGVFVPRWNALLEAVEINVDQDTKIESIEFVAEQLDRFIGELEGIDPSVEIPRDLTRPVVGLNSLEGAAFNYSAYLHPFIARGCARLLMDGHHAQAIEEAAKAVSEYLRRITGNTLDGVKLAENAFSASASQISFGDLADESVLNEQIGFMDILKGFARGVRNPFAHTHGRVEDFQRAFEYLVLASLLCRRIDEAEVVE